LNRLEDIGRELERRGKTDKLKQLADSEDGVKLGKMLDPKAIEAAARNGDSAALSGILSQVLSTAEGKRLAESLKALMQD